MPDLPVPARSLETLKNAAQTGDKNDLLAYANALKYLSQKNKLKISETEILTAYQNAADKGSGEAWARISWNTTDQTLR